MELKILEYLASHGGYALYIDILNAFPTASVTNGFLKILRRNHFIEAELRSGSSVRITDEGRARLEELQQQQDERRSLKNDSQRQVKYNHITIALSGSAALIAFLTLVFMILQNFGIV